MQRCGSFRMIGSKQELELGTVGPLSKLRCQTRHNTTHRTVQANHILILSLGGCGSGGRAGCALTREAVGRSPVVSFCLRGYYVTDV